MNRRIRRQLAHGLRRALSRFRRDDRGSVTIQVIIFSLLLLMSTGLVLDTGRLFTQHSQMQAFTDQMSLAAANELDGQTDSIARAVDAIFGASGSSPYLQKAGIEVGAFEVESVAFYAVMEPSSSIQPNMVGAFPFRNLLAVAYAPADGSSVSINYAAGEDTGTLARSALYAVVKAREAGSRSALAAISRIMLSMGTNPAPHAQHLPGELASVSDTLSFSAVAAASLSEINCAELSTLVFCNPWEDVSPSPLDTEPGESGYSVPGRSLLYFAPNYPNAASTTPVLDGKAEFESIYTWDVNHQLFTLASPLVDAGEVCSESNVPRLFDGESYIVARDRCMMARSQVDEVCWSEDRDLRIRPAHGPSVSRAVNGKFDIWMEPFTSAISNTTTMPGTGMGFHRFFEPDVLATTLWEPGDRYTEPDTDLEGNPTGGEGTVQDGDPTDEYSNGPAMIRYLGHTLPAWGLNINVGVYGNGVGFDICHVNTYRDAVGEAPGGSLCAVDFVGDHYEGATSLNAYPADYISEYWSRMYEVTADFGLPAGLQDPLYCGLGLEVYYPTMADFCALVELPTDIDTWYKMYQHERANVASLDTIDTFSRIAGPSGQGQWCGSDNAPPGGCAIDYQSRYGITADEAFVKHTSMDYLDITGESTYFAAGAERRRIRSAMVNCTATVASGAEADGSYSVATQDLRIMDFYLPGPAGHFCGPNIAGCEVDTSRETHLFVETIEEQVEQIDSIYTAHLVR